MTEKISNKIICADPKAQYLANKEAIDTAIKQTLESGWYILGDNVKKFEQDFAKYIGVNYCVGVGNGTDALCLALKAVGVSAGDEVITVSHTAVATVAAIEQIGAVPVFCDIEEDTLCINPDLIPGLISNKTKAVIAVHIYGQPAKIQKLTDICKTYSLKLIEDCAQSHGARIGDKKTGSFADIAAFSFYPTKNLGAIGDGGAVVCNSEEYYKKLKALREYGWEERYISKIQGVNTRLDEIQAAILQVKLLNLENDNNKRRKIASDYDHCLEKLGIKTPNKIGNTTHAMHLYVIQTANRDSLREHLANNNIFCGIHYPLAVHQQEAYSGRIRGAENLKVTESLYKNILSLPMYPELPKEDQEYILQNLRNWDNKSTDTSEIVKNNKC